MSLTDNKGATEFNIVRLYGESHKVGTPTSVTVLEVDKANNCLLASGATVPTDADAGYAKGCIFIKTGGGVGTTIYLNEGSATSCDFNAIGSGGSTTFIGLTDVPAAFAAASLKYVRVNVGETALEFATPAWVNADIAAGAAIDWSKMAVSTDISATGTVTDLTIAAEARGDILYRNATIWTRLPAGAAGQALVTAGAGADPYWGLPTVSLATSLANTVVCEAGATDYTIDFGTSGGAFTLTVPAVGGHRTFAFLEEAQTFSAVQTFSNTGVHILDTNASHDLIIAPGSDLTADHTLTLTTGDADRTITLGGDLTTLAAWTQVGAFALELTLTGATTVTLPTTGTLATLAGAEALSSKTLTAPKIVTGDGIFDGGGDELLLFVEDATPVNYLQIESADAGLPVLVKALGDDANVDLKLYGKGTGNVVLADGTDPTKQLIVELGGATADKDLTFTCSQTDDRVITFPDATDTLVGKATTDVFTNKTLDCDGVGNVVSNVNANELDPIAPGASTYAVPFIITYTLTNQAAPVNVFNANAPFKFQIIKAWSVSTSADGGTWKLNNGAGGGGTDITNAVIVAAADEDFDEPTDYNNAAWTIASGGSLSVVPDGGGLLDCELFIQAIRVD